MMKQLFAILCVIFSISCAHSQLPSVVEVGQDSFRIKRGEFVLRNETKNVKGFLYNTGFGVTKFVRFEKLSDTSFIWDTDTMYASNASVIGGTGNDTIVNIGSGYAVYKDKNGDQFEMKRLFSDGSIVFIETDDSLGLVVDSAKFATVSALSDTAAAIRSSIQTITASRGLHMNGNDVRWGITPLDSAVDIDQVGNGITFHNGIFVHGTGDFNGQLTAYNRLENNSLFFSSVLWDGANAATSFLNTIAGGVAQIGLQAFDDANESHLYVNGNDIHLYPYFGNLFVHSLRDSAQDFQVYYDPSTGLFTYGASGGGSSGTDSVYTVNSGLSASTPTNFQLGAINNSANPLLHNTWINTDAYTLSIRGAQANWPLQVENTSTGFAARLQSSLAAALQANIFPASTNTLVSVIDLVRGTTGTPANGIGVGSDYYIQTSLGGSTYAGTTGMVWSDVNHTTRTSRYDLFTVNSGLTSRKLSVAGSGRITLDKYGAGLFNGVPVWGLGVLANGDVIEYAPSTGGGGTGGLSAISGTNGLIATTTSNVELGTNPLLHNTTIPTGAFSLSLSGAFSGNLFNVTNTNTTGAAINAVAGSSAIAVNAVGGTYGVYATSSFANGVGIRGEGTGANGSGVLGYASATTGFPLQGLSFTTDQSSVLTTLQLSRSVNALPGLNNIGQKIAFNLKTSTFGQTSNEIVSRWTDATNATRTSQFEINGVNNAVLSRQFAITGPGQMILDKYGIGTFTGGLAKVLGTTSTGGVIEIDPASFGVSGSAVTLSQVDSAADDNTDFDATYFTDDNGVTPITLKTSVVATHSYTQGLIDSLAATGLSGGKTSLVNVGTGDTLSVKVNDSTYNIKSLIAGTNITLSKTSTGITINGSSGSAEVNSIAATITTTANRTLPGEAILQYVLIKPTSALTGVKVGTATDDDYYVTATPVAASGSYTTFIVNEYVPATSLGVYLSGITSSTDIKLIYKLIHE